MKKMENYHLYEFCLNSNISWSSIKVNYLTPNLTFSMLTFSFQI